MLSSCRLSHRRISVLPVLHKPVASHNYSILSRSRVHPLGYAPCIPPHKPPPYTYHAPFSLLAWHAILHSISQTSSMAYSLSDYQHTLLHRPSWQSCHSTSPHVWTIREHLHQSFHLHPLSPCTTALSVHSGLYPFCWCPAELIGCPFVQPYS